MKHKTRPAPMDIALTGVFCALWIVRARGSHLAGGIMTLIITLPIINLLEKANVRKIKGDR